MRYADDLARFDERILEAAREVVRTKRRNEFTIQEVVRLLMPDYPEFSEAAIRKSVISGCVQNGEFISTPSPGSFVRIGSGFYRLGALPE